jgi:hypothetical protein
VFYAKLLDGVGEDGLRAVVVEVKLAETWRIRSEPRKTAGRERTSRCYGGRRFHPAGSW